MNRNYVMLKGGGRLAYRAYGTGARTVLLLHGLVGSSLLSASWEAAAARAGVTLIAVERPGYGESSPVVLERVSDFIPLARQLAQALKLTSACVVGVSAGAPYAYATALALPEVIDRVWILGGVPAVYEEHVLAHYTPEAQQAYSGFAAATTRQVQDYYIPQMQAALERLKNAGAEPYMTRTVEELLAQACYGMAQESRLQRLPWGLELSEIRQPVGLWHAEADEMVPYAAAREMPPLFPDGSLREMELSGIAPGESVHSTGIYRTFEDLLGTF